MDIHVFSKLSIFYNLQFTINNLQYFVEHIAINEGIQLYFTAYVLKNRSFNSAISHLVSTSLAWQPLPLLLN